MARIHQLIAVAVLGLASVHCLDRIPEPYDAYKPSPDRYNFFDAELLEVLSREGYGNVLISPISVKAMLGMIMEAASGRSAEEIRSALRLPVDQESAGIELQQRLSAIQLGVSSNTFKLANQVFVADKYRIDPKYKSKVQNLYGGDVTNIRFDNPREVSSVINNWVANKTGGLIRKLVDETGLRSNAKIMLANAVYFKGKWTKSFNHEKTKLKCFQTASEECVKVPMMMDTGMYKYGYINKLDADAIDIPYEGDRFSMLLVLPKKLKGIRQLSRDMIHVSLEELLADLRRQEVLVQIPKFSAGYTKDLVSYLQKLQISQVFGVGANLSTISPNAGEALLVSNALHSAKVIVNEEGTEAAAATGAMFVPLMGGTTTAFVANHPFLFFLRDTATGAVLFAGKIEKPEIEGEKQSKTYEPFLRQPQNLYFQAPWSRGVTGDVVQSARKPGRALPPPHTNYQKQFRAPLQKFTRPSFYEDAISFLNYNDPLIPQRQQ